MVIKLLTDAAPFPSRAPEYTQLNEKKNVSLLSHHYAVCSLPFSSREANWEAKMVLLVTKWINKSATRVRSSIIRYENTDSSVTTVPSCLGGVSRPCRHTRLHTLSHCSRRSNLCISRALAHSSKTIHSRYSCGWEQNPKSLANLKQSYII